jgi:hypothetical protein
MQRNNRASLLVTIAMVLTVPLIGSALAQTSIAKKVIAKAEAVVKRLASSCKSDITTYCPKVVPGGGKMALCMMAHEDQISDKCYGAMFDAAEGVELAVSNISRAADVCAPDIKKLCDSVEAGEGRIAQCLIDNKSKIATVCRAEVSGLEARFQK